MGPIVKKLKAKVGMERPVPIPDSYWDIGKTKAWEAEAGATGRCDCRQTKAEHSKGAQRMIIGN